MLKHYPVMQSSADGACPLLMCAFASEVSSGDFYAPKDKQQGATMGMPVKVLEGGALAGTCPEWTKVSAHDHSESAPCPPASAVFPSSYSILVWLLWRRRKPIIVKS